MKPEEFITDLNELQARERFIYLIELGDKLPEYPQKYKQEQYVVPGCQSLVYIYVEQDTQVRIHAYAEAKVVKGYLYILQTLLNNKTPQEIKSIDMNEFITQAGLNATTQSSRADAFSNMYHYIMQHLPTKH